MHDDLNMLYKGLNNVSYELDMLYKRVETLETIVNELQNKNNSKLSDHYDT